MQAAEWRTVRAEGGNRGQQPLCVSRDVSMDPGPGRALYLSRKGLCLVAGPTGPVWGCSFHMDPSNLQQGFPPQGRVTRAEGSTLGGMLDTIKGAMRWPLGLEET